MGQTIKCNFNLFREGRKYTGHHRNYILESARNVSMAPETRERIGLREAYGYFGHGRRQLAGKLNLSEVETVKLPGGQTVILENVPSNVTTFFQIDENGNVEHHQEILENNKPGQIVTGLNQSKIGGFSWAMGGTDGLAYGQTKTHSFYGFDYVLNPGFAENRGFVLEDADDNTRDMILENICKSCASLDEPAAEKYLDSWLASTQFQNLELQEKLETAAIYEDHLREETEAAKGQLSQVQSKLDGIQEVEENRRKVIMESAQGSKIVVPKDVLDAIFEMANEDDFHTLTQFFESAQRVDLSGLPLPGNNPRMKTITPKAHGHAEYQQPPEYGSAAAGRGILID